MDSIFTILAAFAFGLFVGMIITSFADSKIINKLIINGIKNKLSEDENAPEIIEIRDEKNQEEDPFKPW